MGRILIVDDDQSLCHFLLRRCPKGIQAIACHTGGEALEVVGRQEIDLILLDNKLPDRSGLEILQEIKRDHPKFPSSS